MNSNDSEVQTLRGLNRSGKSLGAVVDIAPVNEADFQPALLALQEQAPSPLPRVILLTLLLLIACVGLWAVFGQLDIVAQAHGKLVPSSNTKIVQPSEAGIIREILVKEGDYVESGQVLMRLDTDLVSADARALDAEVEYLRLSLRRVESELHGHDFERFADDSIQAYRNVEAQYIANRLAIQDALDVENQALLNANSQLEGARGAQQKLIELLAFARSEEHSMLQLEREGFTTRLLTQEKVRDRVGLEQDVSIQESAISAAQANSAQSQSRIRRINADYRRQLNQERVELSARLARLQEEQAKLDLRLNNHSLRAPYNGVVQSISTHTLGTVVQPGTILMTLVPRDDELRAEVWVSNEDVGFVVPGQSVKLKLAPFQFQKYGMLDGEVLLVSADASSDQQIPTAANGDAQPIELSYRTLVKLSLPYLQSGERHLALFPGMRTTAEIQLGRRSVLEYVLSPVRKVVHDAARER